MYWGSCLEVLPQLEKESVDLLLTDPPYNISQSGKKIDRTTIACRTLKRNGKKSKELNYDFGEWDKFASREDFLGFTSKWVKQCFPLLKSTGNFVSFFDKATISYFDDIIRNCGGYVRQNLVWHKSNPVPQIFLVGFMSATEFLTWATKNKGAGHIFNYKLGQHHNIIKTPICQGNERTEHPTQKPEQVISWLISYLSIPYSIVLDPFCGSGTTAVVCERLWRRWIAIEQSEKFCEIAVQRIEDESRQLKMDLLKGFYKYREVSK